MLKKRIIPCLDIQNGRTVKGVNFLGIKDAGDPIELAKRYVEEGADELVFLDITATIEKRKTLVDLVERIAKEINIPFTVGGGVNSVEDAGNLLKVGADKVAINSSAVKRPELITEIAKQYGSQCVVVAIDTRKELLENRVYVQGGRTVTSWSTVEWAREAEKRGAGEILLTSMDGDGTKDGFDIDITNAVSKTVNIPVIASGGAGKVLDFEVVFRKTKATGALAASIFHYEEVNIQDLKNVLNNQNIPIRWKSTLLKETA